MSYSQRCMDLVISVGIMVLLYLGKSLCTGKRWESRGLKSKKVKIFLETKLVISYHQTITVARIPEMMNSSFLIHSSWIIPVKQKRTVWIKYLFYQVLGTLCCFPNMFHFPSLCSNNDLGGIHPRSYSAQGLGLDESRSIRKASLWLPKHPFPERKG